MNKFYVASALTIVGTIAVGCGAPASGDGAQESTGTSKAAITSQPQISASVSGHEIAVSGSGFTPGGQVDVWYSIYGQWHGPQTVTAEPNCARIDCFNLNAGKFTTDLAVPAECGELYFEALDVTSGYYSNEPSLPDPDCIQ